jgi:ankyrin repeat protein
MIKNICIPIFRKIHISKMFRVICDAAERGDLETVKGIVERGGDINSKDGSSRTPLHFAAMYGHLEIVKFLVERGANKEEKDEVDQTPLHLLLLKITWKLLNF